MSTTNSGNATHDTAVAKSESIRQAATVPGTSPTSVRSADIAHYRTCLASALTNGINPIPFVTALRELGVGGA